MRDFPRLSWINAKTAPQQNGGRKNNPGRKEEHETAFKDSIARNRELLEKLAKGEIGNETVSDISRS
jgi:hypothetical protein